MRLIDADALKERVNRTIDYAVDEFDKGYNIGIQKAVELIDNAPTVEPICNQIAWEQGYESGLAQGKSERPQGEWINHRNDYGHNIADCSLCGKAMQWHDEELNNITRI